MEDQKSYFDILPIAYQSLDSDGNFIFVNQAWLKIFGYEKKDVIGKNFSEFVENKSSFKLNFQDFKTSGHIENVEYNVKSKNKTFKKVMFSGNIEYDGEKVVKTHCVMTDLSKIKEGAIFEAQLTQDLGQYQFFQHLVDIIPVPIFYKDKAGVYLGCNKAFEEYAGLVRKEIIGKTLFDIFPKELALKYDKMDKILYKSPGFKRFDTKFMHAAGFERDVILYKATYSKEKEKNAGLVGIMMDITENKRSEAKIKKLNEQLQEYANKLNLKIKRIDEKRIPLTDKEKMAFYGLVKYPYLNTKQVAGKLGMLSATVNSIKNRLKKEGYFKTIYLPRFDLLGCNFMSIIYSHNMTEGIDKKEVSKSTHDEFFKHFDEIQEKVFVMSTNNDTISLNITKHWSDFKEIHDFLYEERKKKSVNYQMYEQIQFPLDKSLIIDYFDFADILKNKFKLDVKSEQSNNSKYVKHQLNKNEKKLVVGLIKYPELTVENLSKKVGLSVPTICKIRRKLLDENVLKVVNYPDFKKIGMELLVITHKRFNIENIKRTDTANVFFAVSSKKDYIDIGLYQDYTELRMHFDRDDMFKKHALYEKPVTVVIPLAQLKYFKFDYLPFVNKLFTE